MKKKRADNAFYFEMLKSCAQKARLSFGTVEIMWEKLVLWTKIRL